MAVRIQRRYARGCPAGFPHSGGGDEDGEGKARRGYTVRASHERKERKTKERGGRKVGSSRNNEGEGKVYLPLFYKNHPFNFLKG